MVDFLSDSVESLAAMVRGKQVTGFKNSEEDGVGLTDVVPFLVEDMLKQNGGLYSMGEDWTSYALRFEKLSSGWNRSSTTSTRASSRGWPGAISSACGWLTMRLFSKVIRA